MESKRVSEFLRANTRVQLPAALEVTVSADGGYALRGEGADRGRSRGANTRAEKTRIRGRVVGGRGWRIRYGDAGTPAVSALVILGSRRCRVRAFPVCRRRGANEVLLKNGTYHYDPASEFTHCVRRWRLVVRHAFLFRCQQPSGRLKNLLPARCFRRTPNHALKASQVRNIAELGFD